MRCILAVAALVLAVGLPAEADETDDLWRWATTPQWGGVSNPPPPAWWPEPAPVIVYPAYRSPSLTYYQLQQIEWALWRIRNNTHEPFTPNEMHFQRLK